MPKLDEKTMLQRRQHIVDAAMRQFEKQGFGGASVDDICAEAGISKGALYTHFPSKEAIMLALIGQRGDTYRAINASSLAELEDVIFDLMLRGLSYVDSRLEMEAVTIGASNDAVRAALIANTELWGTRIREIVEDLHGAGKVELVNGADPAEAALLIHTYVLGRLSHQIYKTVNLDAEARRGLAITVAGVVRAKS
ncbi:TetR/AcrR family transcriptional regulator [Sphingomonas colocasiae]|uniref:TetR/AcrR family transcriptional regulator n=1 Tax=Sphingomonas colocasiae TaxID=1848973 RepID=A0ABS7PKS4_9SPHN|nr:TetR/AcrR family transcriptional regulator [Sphingomonas colocasiae]MBY8821904.1 TetR/AcrR family transcriptional regulator [Sphingomonas colocasiae]